MTTAAELPGVALTAKAVVEDRALKIDYRLANKGQLPIHVWDLLPSFGDDGPFIDDKLAYVCWEDPKTLRVARAWMPLPVEFRVGKKIEPYVRTVTPGVAIEGKIELPLPVREYNPYYPPSQKMELVTAEKVRLLLGWIEQRDSMNTVPRDLKGRKVLALKGSWTPPIQRLAETTLTCEVQVLKHLDHFDRRMPLE